MFVFLLLIAPALCDWVEISQHHVRNPTRTHNFRPIERATGEYFEETTRSIKTYLNQSLSEPLWSKGNINKVPKIGNVQRVKLDDSPIKAPSLSLNPVINSLNAGDSKTVIKNDIKESVSANSDLRETERHKSSSENERYNTKNTHGTSNIEKVYPPGFSNYKETFQETRSKDERTKTILSNQNKRPLFEELERDNFNKHGSRNPNIGGVHNNYKIPATKQKNVTLRPQTFGIDFDENNRHSVFKTKVETSNIRRHPVNKITPTNTTNKLHKDTVETNIGLEEVFTKVNKRTQNVNYDIKDGIPRREDNQDRQGIAQNKLTNHGFVTLVEKPMDDATVSDEDPDMASSSDPDNLDSSAESLGQEEVEASNNNKVNSLDNLVTFMKVVADTIRKNTQQTVNSKTRYLTKLKDTILANIAGRIDAAWPDDEPAKRSRVARAAHASSRGHVEIPSSESALMTISFLTFAVFLIKLVLQVIQTYKNKAMMVAPAVVAVGRAAIKRTSKP